MRILGFFFLKKKKQLKPFSRGLKMFTLLKHFFLPCNVCVFKLKRKILSLSEENNRKKRRGKHNQRRRENLAHGWFNALGNIWFKYMFPYG